MKGVAISVTPFFIRTYPNDLSILSIHFFFCSISSQNIGVANANFSIRGQRRIIRLYYANFSGFCFV